jgi:hypothetical protein
MRQTIWFSATGCLNIEFLQDLNREREVRGVKKQVARYDSFFRLARVLADRVQQNVGVNEVHEL